MHQVFVLGSAQDGGSPQFGSRARPQQARTAASLCVVAPDGRTLLVDASPDIKAQEALLLDIPSYAARRAREPFDGIMLTHAHMGHYSGLVHFGKEAHNASGVPCWTTPAMASFLTGNAPWSQLVALGNIDLAPVQPGSAFRPWPGLTVRTVPVPHRAEFTDTVGISINEHLLYVPDIDGWDQWPEAHAEVADHPISLLDATFYDDTELPGRDLAAIGHPFVVDTLQRFGALAADHRIVLTHMNHSNPIAGEGSAAAERVRAAGFEVAVDMMPIAVP